MNTTPKPKRNLEAIAALFTALPAQDKSGTERELVQLYLMAVEDIPDAWVAEAAKRFIQGRVVRANITFRPSPPELAVEARRLMNETAKYDRFEDFRREPARLDGPRRPWTPAPPFRPYPALWAAIGADADHRLRGLDFDALTDLSRCLAMRGTTEMLAMLEGSGR